MTSFLLHIRGNLKFNTVLIKKKLLSNAQLLGSENKRQSRGVYIHYIIIFQSTMATS